MAMLNGFVKLVEYTLKPNCFNISSNQRCLYTEAEFPLNCKLTNIILVLRILSKLIGLILFIVFVNKISAFQG